MSKITMTKYQLLTKSTWITDKMIRFGLLSKRYSRDLEVYRMVLDYIELEKSSKNQAAEFIADMKDLSRRTVWNIIQEMETVIDVNKK